MPTSKGSLIMTAALRSAVRRSALDDAHSLHIAVGTAALRSAVRRSALDDAHSLHIAVGTAALRSAVRRSALDDAHSLHIAVGTAALRSAVRRSALDDAHSYLRTSTGVRAPARRAGMTLARNDRRSVALMMSEKSPGESFMGR